MAEILYWMISNRNVDAASDGLGRDIDKLRFFIHNGEGDPNLLSTWRERTPTEFRNELADAAGRFPDIDHSNHEDQKHVAIFVHGFNTGWTDALNRYRGLQSAIFSGDAGLGIPVFFTWPSNARVTDYLADREDARRSADHLAWVLSELYDWGEAQQAVTISRAYSASGSIAPLIANAMPAGGTDPAVGCKAKTSIISHSMGNYVMQCAMKSAWMRKNQPLRVSLINQLVMLAADVDNDLFSTGEDITNGDGEGILNLSYRVTSLYNRNDPALGVSAGLKHFGKRRLGRSGLDRPRAVPDNVWEFNCTDMIEQANVDGHSGYFDVKVIQELMGDVLRGYDRRWIEKRYPQAS